MPLESFGVIVNFDQLKKIYGFLYKINNDAIKVSEKWFNCNSFSIFNDAIINLTKAS